MKPRVLAAALTALASFAFLTGCQGTAETKEAEKPAAEEQVVAEFPRTVKVPAGADTEAYELEIAEQPKRIVALDHESGAVIAALGYAGNLVMASQALQNPALSATPDVFTKVETSFPSSTELNAEQVLAATPDLVVMSSRHGIADRIKPVLEGAGIKTLLLPSAWTSIDSLKTNIGVIAEAIGADEEVGDLEKELSDGLAKKDKKAADSADAKRILVLNNQAGRAFITAGNAVPLELLELAGGTSVSSELGIEITGPISAEQIVAANPDAILLIDMNGSGKAMFQELLNNQAVAQLPAVSGDKIKLIEGRYVQALGVTDTISGLKQLTEWIDSL
ncbi:ABC transporter substrate-binding protein [Leucobacter sp. OH1287]|uniref:ABC transporter substrate-binding protein n=1 Tax=Leucobacter sp. OH1287 TaxID=2491049 RepID=UPI0013157273|nr:ABC transporter substrate-binding protein [Leucobacter sp. OH1287]